MTDIQINLSTGTPRIDTLIQGIVNLYEMLFPKRIRGYYLLGSYHDGSATYTSDIDLMIIFRDEFLEGEEQQAIHTKQICRQIASIHVDLPAFSEAMLINQDTIGLKLASSFIYGEDIREQIQLPSIDTYLHNIADAPIRFMTRLLRQVTRASYPLTYPNPNKPFLGYVNLTTLADNTQVEDTKNLILVGCWITTVTVALKTRQYVLGKSDGIRLHREHINDEWSDFIEKLYTTCKSEWGYIVPMDATEREWLEQMCVRMLDFENHFLSILREWLLSQLQDTHVIESLNLMHTIIFNDSEILHAVTALTHVSNITISRSALELLRQYD